MERLSQATHALVCFECNTPAEGAARGWLAFLGDLDDDGYDELIAYCPSCAEYEFPRAFR